MKEEIKTYYKDSTLPLDILFTDQNINTNVLSAKIYKDECIMNKIKNKTLSGIKIFIHIYDCIKNKPSLDSEYNRIHMYLIRNTTEKNLKKLIREKKIIEILEKLKIGLAENKDINILKKLHDQKLIKDLDFTTIITKLFTSTDLTTEDSKLDQIYLYFTLLYLSPENYKIEPIMLLSEYLNSKNQVEFTVRNTLSSIMKTYYSFELNTDDFEKWLDEYMGKTVGKNWEIYLYFNFDSRIINKDDLNKIINNLKNSIYNEKHIKILKILIDKNKNYLESLSKNLNPKLLYFYDKKWGLMQTNNYLLYELYQILIECSRQNMITFNALNFIKEKFGNISIRSKKTPEQLKDLAEGESLQKIILMIEVFSNKKIDETQIINLREGMLKQEEGVAEPKEIDTIIKLIKDTLITNGPAYIDINNIKLFLHKYETKIPNLEYDEQQELYYILEEMAKTSTLLTDIIKETITSTKEVLVENAENYIKSTMINNGLGSITPVKLFETATNIASTAKSLVTTAGIGFATAHVYKNIDSIFGQNINESKTTNSIYAKEEFDNYKKNLVLTIGTSLAMYTSKDIFPKLSELAQKYIWYKSSETNMPKLQTSTLLTVIGPIITGGLTLYLSNNTIQSGGAKDDNSLLEKIINFILEQIDKLFGFNGKKPQELTLVKQEEQTEVKSNKSTNFESVYLHLKDRLPEDLSDIFTNVELNEHPDQKEILKILNKKYSDFSRLTTNSYLNLSKKDINKIKRIIAQIVNLEINLFKESDNYTFVKAFKDFINV